MDNDTTPKNVKDWQLILIGLSAGIIATFFPRVFTYLSNYSSVIGVDFVATPTLLAVGLVFSLMIALAMVWIYSGTEETTRNLFFSALALPAILSGGMNMSNDYSKNMDQIRKYNSDRSGLLKQVSHNRGINIEDTGFVIPLDSSSSGSITPVSNGISVRGLIEDSLVTSAYAEGGDGREPLSQDVLNALYVPSFGSSSNRDELVSKMEELQKKDVTNLKIVKSGDIYYLIQNKPMKDYDAIEAVEQTNAAFGEKSNNMRPAILRVK